MVQAVPNEAPDRDREHVGSLQHLEAPDLSGPPDFRIIALVYRSLFGAVAFTRVLLLFVEYHRKRLA